MPSVPRYNEGQIQTQALPNARVSTDAPLSAFGGGQSLDTLTQANVGALEVGQKVALEEKKKADDVATTEFYTNLAKKKQEMLWDPKAGALARKGKDSFGALEEYGQGFDKYADDLEKGLANEEQRAIARKIRQKERLEFDDTIQKHTFNEAKEFEQNTLKSGIETARNDGVLNYTNSKKVEESIKLQEALAAQTMRGQDPETVKAAQASVRSKTQAGVIDRMLAAGQVGMASAYYSKVGFQVTGEDKLQIEAKLEQKKQYDKNITTWGQVGASKLADGSPDFDAMKKAVYALPIPTEDKEKRWDYVKTRATEENQQRKAQEGAQAHAFTNETLQARQSGKKLDQVLDQIVPKYGGDPVRQHDLSEIAKKLFTTDIKTDPETYFQIWESIKEGAPDGVELIKAGVRNGKISGNDMGELLKLTYNDKHKEDEYMKSQVVDGLKTVAQEELGNNRAGKREQLKYLGTLLMRSRGKSPEETQKIGQDLLKMSGTSKGWLWDSKEEAYKGERKKIDATNEATGLLHRDLGEKVTDVVGGPDKIDKFLKDNGYKYDDLKQGSPVNNAILALKQHGKPVSRKWIDYVLKTYKDGIIR
jgi:hypothetical protein